MLTYLQIDLKNAVMEGLLHLAWKGEGYLRLSPALAGPIVVVKYGIDVSSF